MLTVNLLDLQVGPETVFLSCVSQVVVVKSLKQTLFTRTAFSPSVFTVLMYTGNARCLWNEEKLKACLIIIRAGDLNAFKDMRF